MTRRAAFFAFLGFVIACGSAYGSDPDPATPFDGGVEAAAPEASTSSDAEAGAPKDGSAPCDPNAPFGPPVQVVMSGNQNATAALSEDELTIFFDNFIPGPSTPRWAIFTASRASLADTFSTGSEIAGPVASPGFDTYQAALTADALGIVFVSNRDGAGYHLFRSARTSTASDFAAPQNLTMVNAGSGTNDLFPFLTADGNLWFTSGRPDPANQNIFRAQAAGADYAPPAPVSELNSPSSESKAVLSRDSLTVIFGSQRATGKGGFDIWTATRSSKSTTFGNAVLVSELSSAQSDIPTWISADSCRLYIASDRSGTSRTYVASRRGK